jgi:hypothetical protein
MSKQVKANVRVHGQANQEQIHNAVIKFIKKSKGGNKQ